MSEQQVLPPKPVIRIHDIDLEAWDIQYYSVPDADAYMNHLESSLAQSEAERERLQGEVEHRESVILSIGKLIGISPYGTNEDFANLLADEIDCALAVLREDLARERELNQGLRQVVKDAYDYIPMETLRLKIRNLLAAPTNTPAERI